MFNPRAKTAEKRESPAETGQSRPPVISLPKGGGAIRGMGEKFAANPVTGTGSMSVPLATSPGRPGFGPQLSLSYDSGAGNGPFGFGWNLSLPSITRKTDKGLPRYQDTEESDVFILSGAEDLVPVLLNDGGTWRRETVPLRTVAGKTYRIQRYRPRIEGLFARIERWTNQSDANDTFWRSISKDNVTTWYGKTAESRILDPADPTRIFSWLICESHDDKGNVIIYGYRAEDSYGVDLSQAHERNRSPTSRSAKRYLKRIRYGNHVPCLPKLLETEPWPAPVGATAPDGSTDWFFEAVFDYGDHDSETPLPDEPGKKWPCRNDPFSSYRASFEVRTYRLCQRILMFHHFPGEDGVGTDCLVRSTDLTYSYEEQPADPRNPIFSFLLSAAQSGYKRRNAGYLKKSLPPLEFEYTKPTIDETIQEVGSESLENLPYGLDNGTYQWVDLDGEGLSGVLTEQAEGWFYKRNLSPVNTRLENGRETIAARFAPLEQVAQRPSLAALTGGRQQFLDLAGDGQVDLVELGGPTPGFFERTEGKRWETFVPFTSLPNLAWDNPNLKFVDLTGDGHADILISEDEIFCWHPSLAEAGFGLPERVRKALDEEKGPKLVLADGTQSIYLSDMSGDGLTDLVRIRNGEVCYWPNLGYGRFGAKVTMDNAPWFDAPDLFDQRRIRLADIDGSGVTDILYLSRHGVQVYFNQSGNSWSAPTYLTSVPPTDNVKSVTVVDLLGNGTACLVWSSPLPGDARRPMRYLDLMGGQKPHLLVTTKNNLGAETRVQYAPSTRFYLQDRLDGKPWVTRLPFPVHCVEKVTATDKWRKTVFSSTYSYHHGYFDGIEREFRGFGRVEQLDSESYGEFASSNSGSPYITDDKMLYQPPVKTVTWYHTGALLDRGRILSQFEHEYFPCWFEDLHPDAINVLGGFQENVLPQPDLAAEDLSGEEWREALRACKGMMLRQEVYELDVDALERGEHRPVKLFSTAYHNCHIRRLQAMAENRYAVFLVAESEAITYHYELDLTQHTLRPDPRIAHTLNLKFDEYANILQSAAVVYPRLGQFEDNALLPDELAVIRRVQHENHLAYTENRYTSDVDEDDNHRLRVPCEVLTYELTGISPEDADDRASSDPRDNRYLTLDELRRFRLSLEHQSSGEAVPEIPYQQLPTGNTPEKRLVEHLRMLFFRDDSTVLADPLPFRKLGRLGLPYETYKLALTEDLLSAVFSDATGNKLDKPIQGTLTARQLLNDANVSGYLSGTDLVARFASIPATELAGQYWIRSGIAGFAPDAAQHFYLPERYEDPFGNVTKLEYDPRDLFVASSTDPMGNITRVTKTISGKFKFDFRILAPREMQDINDNFSEVFFDALGLPTAVAVKGKGNEGDNASGFNDALANPDLHELTAFFNAPAYDEAEARRWLGNVTARHVYYLGETAEKLPDGKTVIHWGQHPACACSILRERHVSHLAPGEQSPLQAAFEYSDGMGSVVVKKVQAEPEVAGRPLRWVANGKTILNNKRKPVKQYEPYFSRPEVGHRLEEPREEGVTPVNYYDAVGRTVRTEMPDGSFSRVEFSPWHVKSYDPNDTAFDSDTTKRSDWYARRMDPTHPRFAEFNTPQNVRAAKSIEAHADTPALTILDSLGREVISIAHNRVRDAAGALKDEKYLTFTKLDAEGKPLWIRDARNNLVMQYIAPPVPNNQSADPVTGFVPCYDIAGNLLFQHSMDAGDRWMLNDAAGKPMFAWDSRGHVVRTDYDALHRPVGSYVKGGDPLDANRVIQFEKVIYGDTRNNGLTDAQNTQLNLRGKPYQHHDTAGIVISIGRNPASGADEAFDFKANLLRSTRQLISDYKNMPDWSQNPALEVETFTSATRYDALNRPIQLLAPHRDQPGASLNVIQPGYNEANLLERVDVWLEETSEPTALLNINTATQHIVKNIDCNAKGQRERIEYGNGVTTTYAYDEFTFRLAHLQTLRGADALQDLSYTYDPVGNITYIRDDAQHTVYFRNTVVEPSNDYTYDTLYRLIEATGREHLGQAGGVPVPTSANDAPRISLEHPNDGQAMGRYEVDYLYDEVGNILSVRHLGTDPNHPGWKRCYQYALDSNRLLSTGKPSDPNIPDSACPIHYAAAPVYAEKYAYDTHGNMTSMPHLPLMDWNFKDQLQSVDLGGGGTAYCVYDASGQRARKVVEKNNGNLIEERIYLGGSEIFRQRNGNGVKLERETLHITDDKQRIALVDTKTVTNPNDDSAEQLIRYQFGNHLGSASLELDDQAQVISYEEHYPYGSTSYQAVNKDIKAATKRYRYTGKERDEESGLYYHGARYYAPWLGRWVSCDPAGLVDGPNSFAYVQSNPVGRLDPTGNAGLLREWLDNPEFRAQTEDWVKHPSPRAGHELFRDLLIAQQMHRDRPVGFAWHLAKNEEKFLPTLAKYGYRGIAEWESSDLVGSAQREFNRAYRTWYQASGSQYLNTSVTGGVYRDFYQGTPVRNAIEAHNRLAERSEAVLDAIRGANLGLGAIGYGLFGDVGAIGGNAFGGILAGAGQRLQLRICE